MEIYMLMLSIAMFIAFFPGVFEMYKTKHFKTMGAMSIMIAIQLVIAVDAYVKSITGE